MKFNDRLFEDFSKVAGGAASLLTGIRDHMGPQQDRSGSSESVTRAEFEAVRDMAARARETQDLLERRIAVLESMTGGKSP